MPVEDVPVRARTAAEGPERLAEEAAAIRARLPSPCHLVALDRRGKALSSRAFGTRLSRLVETWPHPVAFLVGSDLGLDPGLVEEAQERLSLGPLTLPHALARLVLYEQLYRAFALAAGIKYHRDPL